VKDIQIIHCQLRVDNADLRENLHSINLADTPACTCGHPSESTEHYILECPNYSNERDTLLEELTRITVPSLEIILNGDPELSEQENREIVTAVHGYLKTTKRLT
jgi:hypothetical protein